MKILYAIQGTGNGHLARATEIVPVLNEIGETDILVSGIQGDIRLPFPVKYKLYGFSFIFGEKGGVAIWKTIKKARLFRLVNDIRKIPVREYDLVINDFEPVTAWACKLRKKSCIGLSHQNAVLHPKAARPEKRDRLGEFILKHYAPAKIRYGFHFKQLDDRNFTPVIRSSIRKAKANDKGHCTVYLPAFSDSEIEKILGQHKSVRWEVFSKHCPKSYTKGSIQFNPVSLDGFNRSFVSCAGIVCTAGFETPAEALFMGKKLCVIPMKNQYEQACNAAMLAEMGVPVITKTGACRAILSNWLQSGQAIQINYPDNTRSILKGVIQAGAM
ncbi:glycosyltransferase family protein [Draconibacterium sp. IB214405]|uniref:glycosyltransferase family protein n=1 Tax=Draconibacterium sp. IB214405 TaxID=3097352 RepID=UPI002A178FD9|nr:glycosyltransferase family protein [Draconibacterium sp. IB214405]MDX8338155.1 glycosyltransferase family protein [Draconibacterium sp. IB214405]